MVSRYDLQARGVIIDIVLCPSRTDRERHRVAGTDEGRAREAHPQVELTAVPEGQVRRVPGDRVAAQRGGDA